MNTSKKVSAKKQEITSEAVHKRIQTAEGWKRSMLKKYPDKKIGSQKKGV